MKETMAVQIAALQEMTLADLREKYHEVFGEETRSRHRDFLWKRIAWRLQALEQGDLSERAKHRAAELANDADVRVRAPSGAFDAGLPSHARTQTHAFPHVQDARLPMPGTVLTRDYKGRVLRVTVRDEDFEYEGRVYLWMRLTGGAARAPKPKTTKSKGKSPASTETAPAADSVADAPSV